MGGKTRTPPLRYTMKQNRRARIGKKKDTEIRYSVSNLQIGEEKS